VPASELMAIPHVNLHMSMLPHCRGAHPLFHAVRLGLPVGCTVHWMDVEIDTGAIIAQQLLAPAGAETMRELYDRAEELLFELLRLAWPEILALKPGRRQVGPATFHRASELPDLGPKGWGLTVDEVRAMGGLPPMAEDEGFVSGANL
jgi:methionyl-tRNA formyltransferase